jgi:antitoxin component of RelBE/YafQ-DinJ toxin-antitoxin module
VCFDLFSVDGVFKAFTNDDMQNDTIITLRCTKELRDKLKAAAKEVNMPVSVFLRIVLTRIVKQP